MFFLNYTRVLINESMNSGDRLLLQNYNYFSYGRFIFMKLKVWQETTIYYTQDIKLNIS